MAIRLPSKTTSHCESAQATSAQINPPTELMSIRAVMNYLSVSDPTIRRWIRSGNLRSYKAGRQVRIDKADLISFLSKTK